MKRKFFLFCVVSLFLAGASKTVKAADALDELNKIGIERFGNELEDLDKTLSYGLPFFDIRVDDAQLKHIWKQGEKDSQNKIKIDAFSYLYDKNGQLVNASFIKLSMHGTSSLSYKHKAMRLYFKDDYGEGITANNPNKLKYPIFGGNNLDRSGEVISSYKNIILRAGGNDASLAMMRDMVVHRICKNLYCDTQAGQPAIIYINGKLTSVNNVRERYDEHYVANHYGIDKDDVVLLETPNPNIVNSKVARYELNAGEESDLQEYMDLMQYVSGHDMKNEAEYKKVTEQIDINSLIDMCCAQLFFGNGDWADNNIRVWKNKGTSENVDNRWHYMLCDLDLTLGNGNYPSSHYTKSLTAPNSLFGYMTHSLLKNPTFKKQFQDRYTELIDTTFAPSKTVPIVESIKAELSEPIKLNIEHYGEPVSYKKWQSEINTIENFLKTRAQYAKSEINLF